jgi:hypothetical protein
MLTLPARFADLILCFASLYRQRTWRHAQELLIGAILVPGVRTVASVLRVLGRAHERHFVNFHRVLNRAVWSPRKASRILLALLVRSFAPEGPIVLGIDNTLERRRGARIAAKGIYHDAVRSSRSHFVKASGLRWLSVSLLAPIPWAKRVWALPVMTALAPSERYNRESGRRHKRLTGWARQLLKQMHRWLPGRQLIMLADSSFAALELLAALAPQMTCITRLRLDACLYAPAPARPSKMVGRPRKKGPRLPPLSAVLENPCTHWQRLTVKHWYGAVTRTIKVSTGTGLWYHAGQPVVSIRWVLIRDPQGHFEPQALLCTDTRLSAKEIVSYFVRRWQVEVTFEEARRHLGFETQRQWSDKAIARSTPSILALFSVVTLLATRLVRGNRLPLRGAAWYEKSLPTFSDALGAVRAHLWRSMSLSTSTCEANMINIPRTLFRRLHEAACYAA